MNNRADIPETNNVAKDKEHPTPFHPKGCDHGGYLVESGHVGGKGPNAKARINRLAYHSY